MEGCFKPLAACLPSNILSASRHPMQPGGDRNRKRPATSHHISRRRSRRRSGDVDDEAQLDESSSAEDVEEADRREQSGAAAAGFERREASAIVELERQLREQTLLNQLLQSRSSLYRRSGADSSSEPERLDPRLERSRLSLQGLRQPAPFDQFRYDREMEILARHASDRALGLTSMRRDYESRSSIRNPADERYDRRQLLDPSFGALSRTADRGNLPRQYQQMIDDALLQQRLSQERTHRRHAGLNEPLTNLERFSRGLGDYAMVHHQQRLREASLPSRVSSLPIHAFEGSSQDARASMGDMRSAHRSASLGFGGLPVEEQKSSASLSKTNGIPMALPSDVEQLTVYQVLIRRSLEYFVAGETDATTSVRGRKQKIRVGQIGVRCKYCANVPLRQRSRGAVYYAKSLINVYQAAQNIATAHFAADPACPYIPPAIQEEISIQRPRRDASKAGRSYWVAACQSMGIVERDDALWFDTTGQVSGQPKGKSEEK